jgi:pimeloyl-ACP methyl ester carboxylesterase
MSFIPLYVRRRTGLIAAAAAAFGLAFSPAATRAELVTQEYLGLTVSANLELAKDKTLKDHGALLLVHDTLGHHSAPTVARLQAALAARGVNTLAISLSLGLNKRAGNFDCSHEHDHRHGDASDEIVSWVEWLQAKDARRISLFGHVRGAAQVALSVAERQDLGIERVVLAAPAIVAPARLADRFNQEFGKPLAPTLAQARKLVEDGEGDTLLTVPGFLSCPNARTTAAAFLDYYGGDSRQDAVTLLPDLKLPTLVVLAGADQISAELEKTLSLPTTPTGVARQTVNGADPQFQAAHGDKLADAVATFLTPR